MIKKTKNTKPFKNQWITRSNDEIQKIINKFPLYTKKDFRGEGKNNKRKILTRKETERPGLIFGHKGNKLSLVAYPYRKEPLGAMWRPEPGQRCLFLSRDQLWRPALSLYPRPRRRSNYV